MRSLINSSVPSSRLSSNSYLKRAALIGLALFMVGIVNQTFAQSSVFTYQGRLQDGGTNANGPYDFQFTLWDAASGGTQQPQAAPVTVSRPGVQVTSGNFSVQLDFGATAFPGADRYLEMSVQLAGGGPFTTLSPRKKVTGTPYAIRSASAATADTVTDGSITTAKLADTSVTSAKIADGTIVNADVSTSAAIADTKLATISTALKVSNSATTATSANTANAIVARDASGNFSAGTITGNLTGNASTATSVADNSITSAKILDGTIVNADVSTTAAIVDTKLATISTALKVSNSATTATSANTASAIVARDVSGNFSAGTITANLTGNASTATTAGNVTGVVAIANGGTGSATQNFVDLTTAQTVAGTKTFSVAPVISAISNTVTLTLPNTTDTLVGRTTTDTLANKSLANASTFLIDGTDATKKIGFDTSGATTATTLTVAGVQTANRTITLPDADTTLVGTNTSQTLTNKTIDGNNNTLTNITATTVADGSITSPKLASNLTLGGTTTGTFSGPLTGNASTATSATTATTAGNVTGVVAIANGGTGSATQNFVDLTTAQTVAGNKTFSNTITTDGNVNLSAATNAAGTVGVINQNGSRLIHTFGTDNFFAGANAGNFSMTGSGNMASGAQALTANTSGTTNTASGAFALNSNTTGSNNTATGLGALQNNTAGDNNTASGNSALFNTTGSSNIGLGNSAGFNLTTGDNNIDIGNNGVAAEAGIIRIGTSGIQTDTFLTGIIHGNGSGLTNLPAATVADNSITSAKIADGTIVNADINAAAAIADTKLATISTALKVSNSATTATSANTANAIVARDASGNFSAGTITGNGSGLTNLNGANLTAGSVTIDKLSPVFGYFYHTAPPDAAATIAPGAAVPFPQDGPLSGIARVTTTGFVLPSTGVYEVTWQVSITEAGQLVLELNGVGLPSTVVGRATGTNQIFGNVLINANAGDTLSVNNSSPGVLTVTPFAGGTSPSTGSLVIKRIQ